MNSYPAPRYTPSIDGLTLAAILFMALIGLVLVDDLFAPQPGAAKAKEVTLGQPAVELVVAEPTVVAETTVVDEEVGSGQENPSKSAGDRAFAAPYKKYTITQGLHGFSYGHAAIDIAAGQGAKILSPINGEVTELYVDQYGNPTLVIENDIYRVTMMHGEYTVDVGDQLKLGQKVGRESNLGYTTDMSGQLCAGRNCGYHTHLNVFDKRIGDNVNPLELID
jgi:murein DD-endopeptidase MepM/ murein hydrolase activator NlpD